MNIKRYKYWLWGGIITPLSIIIIFLIYRLVWVPIYSDSLWILIPLLPGVLLTWPLTSKCLLSGFMANPEVCPIDHITYRIIFVVSTLIAWFIIGSLIGYIYGKIKNRNK
jgi:hypothetical protein